MPSPHISGGLLLSQLCSARDRYNSRLLVWGGGGGLLYESVGTLLMTHFDGCYAIHRRQSCGSRVPAP